MIRFTASGAVATPHALQLRVGVEVAGRLSAGAPTPSRDLTDGEVRANLQHFTTGQRGPRATPCDEVVFSGVAAGLPIRAWAEEARMLGIRRIVLHAGDVGGPTEGFDEVVWVVRDAAQADLVGVAQGARRLVVIPLAASGVAQLLGVIEAVARQRPERVVLSWPYPPGPEPADPSELLAVFESAERLLGCHGVAWSIKGLPACLSGRHAARRSRTRNRWYVDADHQGSQALLFFPDIVQTSKPDICRFCAVDSRCDGVATAWLDAGRTSGLHPLSL